MVMVLRILITFMELWITMEENATVLLGRRNCMFELLNEKSGY